MDIKVNKRESKTVKTLRNLVRAAGFEPATYGSGGRRSIQLSYARTRKVPLLLRILSTYPLPVNVPKGPKSVEDV